MKKIHKLINNANNPFRRDSNIFLKCLKSRPVSAVFKRGLAVALRIGRKCDAPTQKAQNSKKNSR
jgi:hypothetical protein